MQHRQQHQSGPSNSVTKQCQHTQRQTQRQRSTVQLSTAWHITFWNSHEESMQEPCTAVVTDLELYMYICLPTAVHFEQRGQHSCPPSHRCKLVLLFFRKPACTLQHVHNLGICIAVCSQSWHAADADGFFGNLVHSNACKLEHLSARKAHVQVDMMSCSAHQPTASSTYQNRSSNRGY